MPKKHLIILVLFVTTAACGFFKPDNLKLISAQELNAIMMQTDILLIDVHVPEQTHLDGTDLFAPFYKIEKYAERLPSAKDHPIYLYCKSGPMGNWAARTLLDMGYTNLYNLKGGIESWKEAGLPMVNNK